MNKPAKGFYPSLEYLNDVNEALEGVFKRCQSTVAEDESGMILGEDFDEISSNIESLSGQLDEALEELKQKLDKISDSKSYHIDQFMTEVDQLIEWRFKNE